MPISPNSRLSRTTALFLPPTIPDSLLTRSPSFLGMLSRGLSDVRLSRAASLEARWNSAWCNSATLPSLAGARASSKRLFNSTSALWKLTPSGPRSSILGERNGGGTFGAKGGACLGDIRAGVKGEKVCGEIGPCDKLASPCNCSATHLSTCDAFLMTNLDLSAASVALPSLRSRASLPMSSSSALLIDRPTPVPTNCACLIPPCTWYCGPFCDGGRQAPHTPHEVSW
mmetsp:Transcript_13749/g.21932  ORF Transcript_13749/g.21932 Transcript_13749/m.21932 type:complete len:228 (-) Transcript_13749:325-1008(-)